MTVESDSVQGSFEYSKVRTYKSRMGGQFIEVALR